MKIKFLKDYHGYKAEQVVEIEETEAKDFIEKKLAEEVKVDALDEAIKGLEEKITKAAEKAATEAAASVTEKLSKGITKVRPQIVVGNDNIESDPGRGFQSFGEFAKAVKNSKDNLDPKLKTVAGLTGGVDADGGFAIPPLFNPVFLNAPVDNENLIDRTTHVDISGDGRTMSFPSFKHYDNTNTNVALGVVASWLSEGETKPTSRPVLETKTLTLGKLVAVVPTTDELLADQTALGGFLTQEISYSIARGVNKAIIRGTGSNQPTGIIGHASTVSVTRAAGNNYVDFADIANMYARADGPTAWLIHPSVMPDIMTMVSGQTNVFTPAGGAANKPFSELMGLPLVPCRDCSYKGTAGDIILSNMKAYISLTKGGVDLQSSVHLYWLSDQTAFRGVFRFAGSPRYSTVITPAQGSDTMGSFVVLATAAGGSA